MRKIKKLIKRLLHCVSPKQNNNMISNYINRVVVIDDSFQEIEPLMELFSLKDIDALYLSPQKAKGSKLIRDRQLLFFDLSMDDSKTIVDNVSSVIRPILKQMLPENFGAYGLIVWTKHFDDVNIVKEKIQLDKGKYPLPLFILALDKTKYLLDNNYDTLFDDITNLLVNNKAAYFFLNWCNSVSAGVNKTISDIYGMEDGYEQQENNLTFLLYKLALNHTGMPEQDNTEYNFTIDAYKSFDELLYFDLISRQRDENNMFDSPIANPWEDDLKHSIDIFAKLNTKMFIDNVNLSDHHVVPGNVYRVKNKNAVKINNVPKRGDIVAIELTPPCDFSNKKVLSRIVAGFIVDCPTNNEKLYEYENKYFKGDNKYRIWPINLDGNIKYICFDFRSTYGVEDCELKDASKFELLFRVSHRLFADILQKFSSHASRLGLSIIQPDIMVQS